MNTKDGGPAFPVFRAGRDMPYMEAGMTLRDYFAAAALNGVQDITTRLAISGKLNDGAVVKQIAESAYDLADAMLAAREASK